MSPAIHGTLSGADADQPTQTAGASPNIARFQFRAHDGGTPYHQELLWSRVIRRSRPEPFTLRSREPPVLRGTQYHFRIPTGRSPLPPRWSIMMKQLLILGSCLAVAFGTTACQDQITEPAPAASEFVGTAALQPTSSSSFGLDREQVRLPSSGRMSHQERADLTRQAINPDDYQCPASTPIRDWYSAEISRVVEQEPAIFNLLYALAADLVPAYDALIFQTTDTPQYFGYGGEYTQLLRKTDRDTKRFWDIYSDDIQLIGAHGTMLLDTERVAATYQAAFAVPADDAAYYASLVREALLQSQTLNGGNHPFFSILAFALYHGGPIPDKIVIGDGILDAYEALGFGDVAAQAIYTHEFAHHIQFRNGYYSDPLATTGSEAERTRYTELMADAIAGYYLTHKRGATMNRKRVEQFLEVFFQVGDCGFTSPGHHGTPNQRMAAARFGFDVADQAQKQGHILASDQFHALFVAAYPSLIAPDAL